MRSLPEIVEIIKQIKAVATDGDVARLLGIKTSTLATAKSRNSIPFSELILFCNRERISLNWLLTGEGLKDFYDTDTICETKSAYGQTTLFDDPDLQGLINKLRTIYKEGDRQSRVWVRGAIEEAWAELQRRSKAASDCP